jgi:hypothetical protein
MMEQPSSSLKTPSDEVNAPTQVLVDEALRLSRELIGVVRDHLDVFVGEARRAAWSLAVLLGAGIVIALLVTFAWSACMDAATIGLMGAGLSPPMALLVVGLGNLVGAALGYAMMRLAKRRIGFPATRRLLTRTGPATT